jgi:RimJ/RimL family protein N-acetyltransferase
MNILAEIAVEPAHRAATPAPGVTPDAVAQKDRIPPEVYGSNAPQQDRELRLAHAADIDALVELLRHDEVWPWYAGTRVPDHRWTELFRHQVGRNAAGAACLWVLASGPRRLGFISLANGEASFAVDGTTLERGLGTAMIRRFLVIGCGDLRLARLSACVQRGNIRAIRCLERQGFRFAGLSRRAFDARGSLQTVLIFETRFDEERFK